ncbi:MAG: hypothetical protein Q9220_006678 [cf. Caloplaca sp. 1 TL-2023]
MRKAAHSPDIFLPLLEYAHLVRHARRSQPVDPQAQLNDRGKTGGPEVVALRMDDEEDVCGSGRVERAVLDQVGVDDGIEACITSDVYRKE